MSKDRFLDTELPGQGYRISVVYVAVIDNGQTGDSIPGIRDPETGGYFPCIASKASTVIAMARRAVKADGYNRGPIRILKCVATETVEVIEP